MRSRPDVHVSLSPSVVSVGRSLTARVTFCSHSTTPCEGVEVSFVGRERRYRRTDRDGETSHTEYHARELVRHTERFRVGTLEPGEQTLELTATVPSDAPPSFRSRYGEVAYELEVRVHIPWWPDAHVKVPVRVRASKRAAHGESARARSNAGDRREEGVELELSVGSDVVAPGGTVRGAVAVLGLGDRRVNGIEVALVTIEAPLVESSVGTTDVDRSAEPIDVGQPGEGDALSFELQVPRDSCTSFESAFRRVTHAVEAKVKLGTLWKTSRAVRLPITIVRGASEAAREAPAVGNARTARLWAKGARLARELGASAAASLDRGLTLEVDGARVSIREQAWNGAPCVAADVECEPIAVGLELRERAWCEFARLRAVDEVDERIQARFSVKAREPAQAAAALSGGVGEALLAFDEATLDDARAAVKRKGGVATVAAVEAAVRDVVALSRALQARAEHIPPPEALAPLAAAYERFAAAEGANLRRGDLSVRGWVQSGVELRVVHRRKKSDGAWVTAVETDRPSDVSPERWREVLSAAGARVRGDTARRVRKLAARPEALAAQARELADAVACARGTSAYR